MSELNTYEAEGLYDDTAVYMKAEADEYYNALLAEKDKEIKAYKRGRKKWQERGAEAERKLQIVKDALKKINVSNGTPLVDCAYKIARKALAEIEGEKVARPDEMKDLDPKAYEAVCDHWDELIKPNQTTEAEPDWEFIQQQEMNISEVLREYAKAILYLRKGINNIDAYLLRVKK